MTAKGLTAPLLGEASKEQNRAQGSPLHVRKQERRISFHEGQTSADLGQEGAVKRQSQNGTSHHDIETGKEPQWKSRLVPDSCTQSADGEQAAQFPSLSKGVLGRILETGRSSVSTDDLPACAKQGSLLPSTLGRRNSLASESSTEDEFDEAAGLVEPTTRPLSKKSRKKLMRMRTAPVLMRPCSIPKKPPPKLRSNRGLFLYATVALATYLALGILLFLAKHEDFKGTSSSAIIDALYFSSMTLTTVGYGDVVPTSSSAKLFASVFVFVGVAFYELLISTAGSSLLRKQAALLREATQGRGRKHISDPEEEKRRLRRATLWRLVTAGGLVSGVVILGVLALMALEGMSFVDAFYASCVSVTSVGYGDKVFGTPGGRLFAVFWLLLSVLAVFTAIGMLAEARLQSQQEELVQWVLKRDLTEGDLAAADMDNDGSVRVAEFVVYKLREMGKVSEEDVATIVAQFARLDPENLGKLNPHTACVF